MSASVEIIVSALSDLESDIDVLTSKVELMRKQILSNSQEQVAFLREKLIAIAKAEAEKAQGTTEAEIIRLRGLAEAEAKEKIAEAFEQYGQAAILDMIIRMMPEYAKQIALPLSNIDKITVVDIGGGTGGGANKVTSYATDLMATLQESLKESSGIDVKQLIESYVNGK